MSERSSRRERSTERENSSNKESNQPHHTNYHNRGSHHSHHDERRDRDLKHHSSRDHHRSSSNHNPSDSKRYRDSDERYNNDAKRSRRRSHERSSDRRYRSSRDTGSHRSERSVHRENDSSICDEKSKEYTHTKDLRTNLPKMQDQVKEMAGEWVINDDDSSSDDELTEPEKKVNPNRDTWMNDESFDFLAHTSEREPRVSKQEQEALDRQQKRMEGDRKIQEGMKQFETEESNETNVDDKVTYIFGDSGSEWRMMKLNKTYEAAKEQNLPVEDLALSRYGSLKLFDDAREEKYELTRRKRPDIDATTFIERPTGKLFRARKIVTSEDTVATKHTDEPLNIRKYAPVAPDYTRLNKLKAEVMKAKLKHADNYEELQGIYDKALAESKAMTSTTNSESTQEGEGNIKILSSMDARILNVSSKSEEDMTVEELAAEERRLNAISGSADRATLQNIGKDKSFSTDLDYMEENASNLAKYIKKGDIDLKNMAINQVKKMEKILDNCPLCMENGKSADTPIVAIGSKVYLTLPPQPELAKYSATIVPITHYNNTLMCEEDEWDEIRNFMLCLAKMYHSLGKGVIFYENAVSPHRNGHAVIEAVPIPLDLSNSAPAFFKDAILTSDEEWSQHTKIIDTGKKAREGAGRYAFKTSIAQEAPYFHVWFTIDGGYGHIVEDSNKWPRGDLFAREVIGGMMRLEPHIIKKQSRRRCNIDDPQVLEFEKKWETFDWTTSTNE